MKFPKKFGRPSESGFIMIELIITMFILSVSVFAVYTLLQSSDRAQIVSANRSEAVNSVLLREQYAIQSMANPVAISPVGSDVTDTTSEWSQHGDSSKGMLIVGGTLASNSNTGTGSVNVASAQNTSYKIYRYVYCIDTDTQLNASPVAAGTTGTTCATNTRLVRLVLERNGTQFSHPDGLAALEFVYHTRQCKYEATPC